MNPDSLPHICSFDNLFGRSGLGDTIMFLIGISIWAYIIGLDYKNK